MKGTRYIIEDLLKVPSNKLEKDTRHKLERIDVLKTKPENNTSIDIKTDRSTKKEKIRKR